MVHVSKGCGGALITNQVVLTAAHCVYLESSRSDNMEVKIPLTGEEILASKLIPHEKYVHKWILGGAAPAPYDVALIFLESPSTYDHEFPKLNNQRCLEEPGSTFEVIGYGNTGGGRYPKEPRGTKLTISRTLPEFSHIFEASSKNSSVCDGDSGSPAIVRKGEEQILVSTRKCYCHFEKDYKSCFQSSKLLTIQLTLSNYLLKEITNNHQHFLVRIRFSGPSLEPNFTSRFNRRFGVDLHDF
nr:unnamed protein product [Callosobruchus chinensis]